MVFSPYLDQRFLYRRGGNKTWSCYLHPDAYTMPAGIIGSHLRAGSSRFQRASTGLACDQVRTTDNVPKTATSAVVEINHLFSQTLVPNKLIRSRVMEIRAAMEAPTPGTMEMKIHFNTFIHGMVGSIMRYWSCLPSPHR